MPASLKKTGFGTKGQCMGCGKFLDRYKNGCVVQHDKKEPVEGSEGDGV